MAPFAWMNSAHLPLHTMMFMAKELSRRPTSETIRLSDLYSPLRSQEKIRKDARMEALSEALNGIKDEDFKEK